MWVALCVRIVQQTRVNQGAEDSDERVVNGTGLNSMDWIASIDISYIIRARVIIVCQQRVPFTKGKN